MGYPPPSIKPLRWPHFLKVHALPKFIFANCSYQVISYAPNYIKPLSNLFILNYNKSVLPDPLRLLVTGPVERINKTDL